MPFPIERVRGQFPALGDPRRVFFDAPGGTQLCAPAIEAMRTHCEGGTANLGGAFSTSREVGALSEAARSAVADLLGADPAEIAFGPNMTSLTLAVSRALARDWTAGDELVVTRLDHDANIAPWLAVAEDRGMTVRWLDFDRDSCALDLAALPALLGPRTRLVAVGGANNAVGTLNDLPAICAIVRAHSPALVYADAVQSVPHVVTDVAALGCDFLAFSPYKVFGPHQGVLWARPTALDGVRPYKVRPAPAQPPIRGFETGTAAFEALAGVLGMVGYLEWLGAGYVAETASRRERLAAAMHANSAYEADLGAMLLDGLGTLPGVRLHGPATPAGRVPTFGLTIEGWAPHDIAREMGNRGIHCWAGHFYAIETIERLCLTERGGLLRLGLCHYNTAEEVTRCVAALDEIIKK